jgi:hypothetical protein
VDRLDLVVEALRDPCAVGGGAAMDKLFIVGCPRSGTTMLQQALNRHSQVVIPPETKFFFSFFGHPRRCQLRHIDRLNADLGINLPKPDRAVRWPLRRGRNWLWRSAATTPAPPWRLWSAC